MRLPSLLLFASSSILTHFASTDAANDVQSSFHIVSALAVEARTTKFSGPPGWDWSLLEDQLAQPRNRLSEDLVRRIRSARPAPDYFATNGIPPGFEVIKPPPKAEKVRMSGTSGGGNRA